MCKGPEIRIDRLNKPRNSVSTSIVAVMQDQISAHPGYHPIVTGHSLGASIASLSSASLVHYFPDLTTYTLGQFRTGNPAYAAYIDRILPFPNMYRITHTNDGIPQTIHKSSGYLHHSTEFWELEPFGPKNTYKCQPGDDDVRPSKMRCTSCPILIDVAGMQSIDVRSRHRWRGNTRRHQSRTHLLHRNPDWQPTGWRRWGVWTGVSGPTGLQYLSLIPSGRPRVHAAEVFSPCGVDTVLVNCEGVVGFQHVSLHALDQ